MVLKYVDPLVRDFAFRWLREHGDPPSDATALSLATDIQHAINAWHDMDEQRNDEMRQLRRYSDGEKARI